MDLTQGPDSLNIEMQLLLKSIDLIFILYCILVGIQELRGEQFVNAKFFSLFGLVFEVLMFVILLIIAIFIFTKALDEKMWPFLSYLIVLSLILLVLIFHDSRKYFQSQPSQPEN